MGCDNSVDDASRSRGYESTAGGQEDMTFVSQSGESIGDECSESPFKLAVKTKLKAFLSKNHQQDTDLLDFEHQLDMESCPTKAVSQWIDESLCVTICDVAGRGGAVKPSALSAAATKGEIDVGSILTSSPSGYGRGSVAGILPESADIDFLSLEGYCGVLARSVRKHQGITSPTSSAVNPILGFLERKSRNTQNTDGRTTFSSTSDDGLDRSRGPKSPQPPSLMVGLGLSSPIPLLSRGERTAGTGSDLELASNTTYNSTHTDFTQVSNATSGFGGGGQQQQQIMENSGNTRSTSQYLLGIGSGTSHHGGGMQGAHREEIVQERLLEHTLRMWNRATELSVVRHYEYHQTIRQHDISELDQTMPPGPEKIAQIRVIRAEIASLDLKEDVQVEDALKEYTPEELMWLAHSIKNHDRILPSLPPHRKFFRVLLPQFLMYLGGDPKSRTVFSYDWFLDAIARLQEDQGLAPPTSTTSANKMSIIHPPALGGVEGGEGGDNSNNNPSSNNSRRTSSSLVLNPHNNNSQHTNITAASSSTTATAGLTSSSSQSSASLATLSVGLAGQQQQQQPQPLRSSPNRAEAPPLPPPRVKSPPAAVSSPGRPEPQQQPQQPPPPLPPTPPAVTDAASSHASRMVADPSKMSTIEIATVHEDAPPGLVNAE